MNVNDTNDFPVAVFVHGGNTFTIEWDEFHPVTSQFNTWTHSDFQHAIKMGLNELYLELKEKEYTVQEVQDNFDAVMDLVGNGEHIVINHEGKKVLLVPADEVPNVI